MSDFYQDITNTEKEVDRKITEAKTGAGNSIKKAEKNSDKKALTESAEYQKLAVQKLKEAQQKARKKYDGDLSENDKKYNN